MNEKTNNPANNLPIERGTALPERRGETALDNEGGGSAMLIEVERSRAIQEVQASMLIAQRFPRDPEVAVRRINRALELTVARFLKTNKDPNKVWGIYSYPRGGEQVSGPNIRMAEIIAQNWRNIRTGTQISHTPKSSDVRVYCVDLETNFAQDTEFTVPHTRYSKRDGNVDISKGDPRDIYELVANMASRRRRACILSVIPGDVIDAAVDRVRELHRLGVANIPLPVRVRQMVEAFAKIGVPPESLKDFLNHEFEAVTESEFEHLREIYTAIKDGHATREAYFSLRGVRADSDGPVPMPQEKKSAPAPQTAAAAADSASAPDSPETPPSGEKPAAESNGTSPEPSGPQSATMLSTAETTRFWTAYWKAYPASQYGREAKQAKELLKQLGFASLKEVPLARFQELMDALDAMKKGEQGENNQQDGGSWE